MAKAGSDSGVKLVFVQVLRIVADAEEGAGVDSSYHADKAILYFSVRKEGDGGTVKVTDLLETAMFGTLPTILVPVAKLTQQGWVVKSVSHHDGRVRVVSSSSMARKFVRKVSEAIRSAGAWHPIVCSSLLLRSSRSARNGSQAASSHRKRVVMGERKNPVRSTQYSDPLTL